MKRIRQLSFGVIACSLDRHRNEIGGGGYLDVVGVPMGTERIPCGGIGGVIGEAPTPLQVGDH